jgi:hypothetical protein
MVCSLKVLPLPTRNNTASARYRLGRTVERLGLGLVGEPVPGLKMDHDDFPGFLPFG